MVVVYVAEHDEVDVGRCEAASGKRSYGIWERAEWLAGRDVGFEGLWVEADVATHAQVEDEAGLAAIWVVVLDEEGQGGDGA